MGSLEVSSAEVALCIICGKPPSSFYVQINDYEQRECITCSLFDIDTNRLFEQHPGCVGFVCLSCLLAYRRPRDRRG